MQMPLQYVTEELVEELELLEPFGKGNTKPVFVEKDMLVLNSRILGKNQNVLKMQVKDLGGTVMDAIYFGEAQECLEKIRSAGGKITATYYPSVNEFRGQKTLQIVIQNYR